AWLTTVARLGTYSTYTDTVVYATYRNVSRLDVSLYRLSLRTFMDLNTRWEAWDRFVPAEGDLVRSWSLNVRPPRNEALLARLDLTGQGGSALPPGLYYVELTAPEVEEGRLPGDLASRSMFVKSALNLTLKQAQSEALVWATDLASGQPVAGLPISLYTTWGEVDASGTTDADGLLLESGLQEKNLWDPFFAVSGEPGSDDFALAYNGWDAGISPWNFNVDSEFWSTDYQGYLYTDRPIYRPGQKVYFKGIVRADDDATYSLPTGFDSLRVLVSDPQGKEVFKKDLSLSDMGTLYDDLQLDEEAALGPYYLELQAPEIEFYASTSFQVAEYEAPEFQVAVTADRDAYLNGERVNAAAEASYYFGGPVADALVRWSVLSSDYSFQYECPRGETCPWYSWSDFEWGGYAGEETYGSFGRLIDSDETRTDAEGRVTFRVPAELEDDAQSQILTVEAAVTDVNNQEVSSRTGVVVHKAEFYVGLAPRGYLAEVGEEKQVDLLTVDWDGVPVPGVELSVVFMEHNWYSVRRESEDGQFYWDWEAQDTPVYTTTVTTDAQGRAVADFVPEKAGSYRVRATGRDENGNSVRSSAYFWVWGGDEYVSWRQESNNRIELIADREEYQVGDVAEILIPSPYSGTVQALVTIERGHIVESEVRELDSNSEVLRVPIVEEHVPNVFVSVIIVEGSAQAAGEMATFKMGVVKLPVSVASKELQITLTPDKAMDSGEHYTPRQTASYDVLVTDYEGNPMEAELSLRLADLAVLALADEQGSTLLDTFWRNRGLGVKTTMPLVVAMEPFNREIRPQAKGGGGGEFDGLMRSRFADTAFWDPVVRTDEDGTAHVEVQLPDNLTTWRMQAQGVTADTRVGLANVDVLSTLDLLVRPVLPRFFVVDDRAEIATVVHNNTEAPLDVEVNINAEGLALEGEASQTVRVPAGEPVKVVWPVQVLPGQEVNVRTWARAGDLYDGREDNLPVYHYSTPEVVATAGQLSEAGQRQEIVQLPNVLDPRQGELTVQIDGSLTAATQDALQYLEHYPYECVEQTVSRFLPNVLTWRTLDEMGVERPELRQRLSQLVGVGLQRLYAQQHYDGGWGWWVSDESDAYLTAYVLHGMLEAHRADFVVDQDAMDRAAAYLRDALPSVGRVDTEWEANRLAYGLYVLAEHGETLDGQQNGALSLAVGLFEKRHLLSRYGQATLAMALGLLEPQEPARVQTLLADLAGDAVLSATGAHWEEREPDYRNMNTDVRTTAIVLWALSSLDPENDLLPNVVRWLMAVREHGGYWESTQVTAWSLLGLTEYMRASGELKGDLSYSVYLNGQEWAAGQVTEENIDEGQDLQVEIARLLAEEANRLVIQRQEAGQGQTGEGQLYYSAQLRYFLPVERVQALDRGIVVARQYSPVESPDEFVDTARVGDVLQVKLSIIAPTDLYYVVVEDPLPAGFEGVDLSLKTTSVVGQAPELHNLTAEEEDTWLRRYGWGSWFFSQTELRDERAVLFASYLPRGTYEYVYYIRASVPGEFMVIPTTAYEMYWPEVFGRSDGARFTVQDVE
ncbi:MAG TPA: alpha-2-macroglobulin family protein, partial [Anaerolineae bacterium]|nr:alpha-2-macroglobulin family protein [Anaerolineae bacterium]